MTRTWGIILLALFLFVFATHQLTNIEIVAMRIIEGLLAVGAGICLLMGK